MNNLLFLSIILKSRKVCSSFSPTAILKFKFGSRLFKSLRIGIIFPSNLPIVLDHRPYTNQCIESHEKYSLRQIGLFLLLAKQLNQHRNRTTLKCSTDCVIEALKICLACSNSKFAKQNFLQSNGKTRGAPNSCSYVDLAVLPIGEIVLSASENTFHEILYFGLYRDDGLTLWVGSMERLCQLRDFLNSLDPNLMFKMTVGENDELTFLDLRIILKNNKLFTTVYSNPTSSKMYLHSDSIHPKSTFAIFLVCLVFRREFHLG